MKNAEELKHKAAIFLEEKWNISGDTQVDLDHNLEDLPEEVREGGAVDLHDIMADFVTDHDNEIISEIEKKIKEEKTRQTNLLEGFEYQNSDGRIEAFIEIINLIKEK